MAGNTKLNWFSVDTFSLGKIPLISYGHIISIRSKEYKVEKLTLIAVFSPNTN